MAIVQVGSDEERRIFIMEKDILMLHSEYFADTLSLRDGSGGTLDVDLPDLDSEAFNIFRHFTTIGQIFSSHDSDRQPRQHAEEAVTDWETSRLNKAWALGEQLRSHSFKDAVVDAMIDKIAKCEGFPISIHETIYPRSNGSSGIRKLIIDTAVWGFNEHSWARQECKGDMSKFYYDLVSAFISVKAKSTEVKPPFADQNTCESHEHTQRHKPCYKTMF